MLNIISPFFEQLLACVTCTHAQVGLLGSVYELVLTGMVDHVANILEQQIFKSTFNQVKLSISAHLHLLLAIVLSAGFFMIESATCFWQCVPT